ncbi:MAG: tRNA (uridine(34)/cytosine(34)/5-carboxymethylaminomethyluridine(34)-2'-O)-methyltransferase TrmL [Francisellaceae bacterium]
MLHVVLYEPEIPPNTGNIIRLCANSGAALHLIEPMGFGWEDKRLLRAGLDYHEFVDVRRYQNFNVFLKEHGKKRIFPCTTKASQFYHQVVYESGDMLLFGPESRGLPADIREKFAAQQIKIPMYANSRSLNLSNAVAIILYHALLSLDFEGLV